MISTADLCDSQAALVASGDVRILCGAWRWFGHVRSMHGRIQTLEAHGCNAELRDLLECAGDGRILVIDAGGEAGALLGDNLASKALHNGWAGVLVNGNIRDSNALAALDLPVVAVGTWPQRSGNKRGGRVETVLDIGGTRVVPGEWLYADGDGVMVSRCELNTG